MKDRVDLSIKIGDISFRNPLFLSEGPLSGSAELINRAATHQVGGVVTKSIRNEPANSPSWYMIKSGKGLINADWSDLGFEQWLKELDSIHIEVPLIVNIATNHVTPDKAAEYAAILQHHGADMVTFSDYEPENLIEAVRIARKNVDVPIMVKLPPFRKDVGELCKKLEAAGVNCIAAMDAVGPAMDIDILTGKPLLGNREGFGYLSSAPIFPLTLAYISEICKNVSVPVIGVGGVNTYKDVIKLIMAGAAGVGIVGGAILHGLGIFDKISKDLTMWLTEQGYTSLDQIRGLSQDLERTEMYNLIPKINGETCNGCRLCVTACFTGAIEMKDEQRIAVIDSDRCASCGVCLTTCPNTSIFL